MFSEEIIKICEKYFDLNRTIDDRYKLLYKLGEGRYGKVYLVYDIKINQLVALKILRNYCIRTKIDSFLQEIKNLVYLKKKFSTGLKITKIIDFNFKGKFSNGKNAIYYTMEFIEFGEFYNFIEIFEELSENLACFFLMQIVQSVSILHSEKIYHLDLKPENILMNEKGELFLCDFGNCLNLKSKKNHKWKKVEFLGSSEYAAPEVYELSNIQKNIKNKKKLSDKINEYDFRKLDAFSIGVYFFVTIFKNFPFGSAKLNDDYFKLFIQDKETYWKTFLKNRNISSELKNLLEKLLSPNFKKRIEIKSIQKIINKKNFEHNNIEEELKDLLKLRRFEFLNDLKNYLSKKYNNYNDRRFLFETKKIYSNEIEIILQKFFHDNINLIQKLKNSLLILKSENFLSHSTSELSNESNDNEFFGEKNIF